MTKNEFYRLAFRYVKGRGKGWKQKDFANWVNSLGIRFGNPDYCWDSDAAADLAYDFIVEASTW